MSRSASVQNLLDLAVLSSDAKTRERYTTLYKEAISQELEFLELEIGYLRAAFVHYLGCVPPDEATCASCEDFVGDSEVRFSAKEYLAARLDGTVAALPLNNTTAAQTRTPRTPRTGSQQRATPVSTPSSGASRGRGASVSPVTNKTLRERGAEASSGSTVTEPAAVPTGTGVGSTEVPVSPATPTTRTRMTPRASNTRQADATGSAQVVASDHDNRQKRLDSVKSLRQESASKSPQVRTDEPSKGAADEESERSRLDMPLVPGRLVGSSAAQILSMRKQSTSFVFICCSVSEGFLTVCASAPGVRRIHRVMLSVGTRYREELVGALSVLYDIKCDVTVSGIFCDSEYFSVVCNNSSKMLRTRCKRNGEPYKNLDLIELVPRIVGATTVGPRVPREVRDLLGRYSGTAGLSRADSAEGWVLVNTDVYVTQMASRDS